MSDISERDDRPGQEDAGPVGPAVAKSTGAGKHAHAEREGGKGGDDENGSETARFRLGKHSVRGQGNEDDSDEQEDSKREVVEGKPEKRLQQPGIVEVGHGMVAASAAASAVLGCVVLFPVERALVQALVLTAGYPCSGALFYVGYRRWGRWMGAPPQFGPACFVMALASWFLLASGDPDFQRGAFWFAQTALLVSGVSIGGGLAVVAAALDTDWRGAIRAAVEADRAATRRFQAGGGGR